VQTTIISPVGHSTSELSSIGKIIIRSHRPEGEHLAELGDGSVVIALF